MNSTKQTIRDKCETAEKQEVAETKNTFVGFSKFDLNWNENLQF